MPSLQLPSHAEQQASRTADLAAFAGLNLQHVRQTFVELQAVMQTNGVFYSYTGDYFAHVDRMLTQLDWLIPHETHRKMTAADWLLIVLAAYLHDLGLIVTRDEFSNRNHNSFASFKERVLTASDPSSMDYRARIVSLPKDDLERFLYQEYVRQNHSRRIRTWIEGESDSELSIPEQVTAEVLRILEPLPSVFREDLILVCESHHLDDLADVTKYPVSRPYGPAPDETANVQYAAILLRSIDLINITLNRTPSIPFLIIDPQDPLSQNEWPKQAAVRAVRPKLAQDADGNLDPSLPGDTLEVHASFDHPEGFFGFISYLSYVESQIGFGHDLIAQSNRRLGSSHQFHWRYIDVSHVEARGFYRQSFQFTIDQDKILDLLIGHTLYDDSSVVVRELLQNAVDAVRLIHGPVSPTEGIVEVRWDSSQRVLEVFDNGIGMTQEVIERYFLRAGSSYYWTAKFREEHPNFSSISRFGIGVLSAFMLADRIEVVTCHIEEPQALQLELRGSHGKYLVRMLDKNKDSDAIRIGSHGTIIRLQLRPSAELRNIAELARRWMVVPECKVTVYTDETQIEEVGYSSVKAALEAAIASDSSEATAATNSIRHIRVVQMDSDGLSLAFAIQWNDYLKEWGFVSDSSSNAIHVIGTCVEGVRVQTGPPGLLSARFDTAKPVLAIANFTGPRAPRANLARSSFEYVSDYDWLKRIYLLYAEHVTAELEKLQNERGKSLTGTVSQAPYLLQPLIAIEKSNPEFDVVMSVFGRIPMLLLEEGNKRLAISIDELADRKHFYTVDGALLEHVEYLLQEMPGNSSLTAFLDNLGSTGIELPKGPILGTRLNNEIVEYLITRRWQIAEIRGAEGRQRCEAKWIRSGGATVWSEHFYFNRSSRWNTLLDELSDVTRNYSPLHYSSDVPLTYLPVTIPIRGVTAIGFDVRYSAVVVGRRRYLLPNSRWPSVVRWSDDIPFEERSPSDVGIQALSLVLGTNDMPLQFLEERIIPVFRRTVVSEFIDFSRLIQLRREIGWRIFDTRQRRRGSDKSHDTV